MTVAVMMAGCQGEASILTASLRSPADCRGLVIRTLESAAYPKALAALGFGPMTPDVKDLLRVVEAAIVQAQENPLTNLLSFSLWHHHPHVSLSGHFLGVLSLVCPRAWHEALDDNQRRALDAAVATATREQRALAQRQDEAALTAMRAHGMQVLLQELDMPALRAATTAGCGPTLSILQPKPNDSLFKGLID